MRVRVPLSIFSKKREHIFALGIFGIFFGFLLFPLLSGGGVVSHPDALYFEYPFLHFIRDRLGTGVVFWNDLNTLGFPSVFLHGHIFQPALIFFLVFVDAITVLHWTMFLYAVVSAFFVYLTARKTHQAFGGSILVGVLFPLAFWSYNFSSEIFHIAPLLAIFAYCSIHLVLAPQRKTLHWSWLGQCVVSALATLSLHPTFLFLFFAAAGLFLLTLWRLP